MNRHCTRWLWAIWLAFTPAARAQEARAGEPARGSVAPQVERISSAPSARDQEARAAEPARGQAVPAVERTPPASPERTSAAPSVERIPSGPAARVQASRTGERAAVASAAERVPPTSAVERGPSGPAARTPEPRVGNSPREPLVSEVVRMALQAAQASDPARTRELARRARLSGLLPTMRVGVSRRLQQDLSATSGTTERTNASLGDDLNLDATLSFDLSRLVFASEEVRLASLDRWLVQDRRKLIEEVVRLYYRRKRLLYERAQAPAADPELEFALAEVEAWLDGLTAGAYGEALRGAKRE